MGLELTKQIYGKPPSTPLTSWIFRVRFYYLGANGLQNDFQYQLNQPADISSIPIRADLPKFETKYVTQKFFGSEKSYSILICSNLLTISNNIDISKFLLSKNKDIEIK